MHSTLYSTLFSSLKLYPSLVWLSMLWCSAVRKSSHGVSTVWEFDEADADSMTFVTLYKWPFRLYTWNFVAAVVCISHATELILKRMKQSQWL